MSKQQDTAQGGAPTRPLRLEITGILVVKVAIILLAGVTVFGARHRLHVDAGVMTERLFSAQPSAATHSGEGK